jgi:hypothetical protein
MNLFVRIVLIAVLSAVAQQFFPWWSAVIVAFAVEALFGKANDTTFFSGFYGIAIPWMIYAGYIDAASDSILSVQVLQLFKLPPYGFVMVIITGFLGGLYGGFASVVGGWVRQAIKGDE